MNGRVQGEFAYAAPTFAEATDPGVLHNTVLDDTPVTVGNVDAVARGYAAWAELHNSPVSGLGAPDLEPVTVPIERFAEGLVLGYGRVVS